MTRNPVRDDIRPPPARRRRIGANYPQRQLTGPSVVAPARRPDAMPGGLPMDSVAYQPTNGGVIGTLAERCPEVALRLGEQAGA